MEQGSETPATTGRRGRPRGDTRDRILDVALELFTEQGYDNTSLRQIADRLGYTKASLYYHFTRKEEILLALHMRMHAMGRALLDQIGGLDDPEQAVTMWPRLLDDMITAVVDNRELIVLHQRNHNALERLERSDLHDADHDDLQARVYAVLSNPAIPLAQRVRLGFAFSAVLGTMAGSDLFAADPAELADGVRAALRDLFPDG